MQPVLLVEDATKLADAIARGMTEEGYAVERVSTGEAAIARLARADVSGVILDLGLPDMDGALVLDAVRARGLAVPVLVLTARDAVESRVGVLKRGADDYLAKPFAFEELLARIEAMLRRASGPRWAPLSMGDVALGADGSCTAGAEAVVLAPKERELLRILLRRRGEIVSRREILEAFGYGFDPGTNIVAVHVTHLRKKLASSSIAIEAVRVAGYRLIERG
jgi:two-component system OmpR family response regulator